MSTRVIQHDQEHNRFLWTQEGHVCVVDYALDGDVMQILHTGVPAALGGQGIAGDLVRAALDTARAQGWRVRSFCSYATAYLQRHPEYQDLVAS